MTDQTVGQFVSTSDLREHPKNPRHNDEAVGEIANSIKRFGFTNPIVANEDGTILCGHTRFKAARSLGLQTVPVVYVDLNPTDSELLMIADNKLGERANWDKDLLAELLGDLEARGADLDGLGFDDEELSNLLDSISEPVPEDLNDETDIDLQSEPVSREGEIYQLGEHFVICGDSTEASTFEALLGDTPVDIIVTDPPYGVSLWTGSVEEMKKLNHRTDGLIIENDDLTGDDLEDFLDSVYRHLIEYLRDGGVCYTFSPPDNLKFEFLKVLIKYDLVRHGLIWLKDRISFGRCDYHYKHEEIFYGWKKGAAHHFTDDRSLSSVFEFPKPSKNPIHPTMKPVGLIAELIRNSSTRDSVVLDPFGGSGSTLIAAQETGRRAYLVEKSPRYVDAIRRRWTLYAEDKGLDKGEGL